MHTVFLETNLAISRHRGLVFAHFDRILLLIVGVRDDQFQLNSIYQLQSKHNYTLSIWTLIVLNVYSCTVEKYQNITISI